MTDPQHTPMDIETRRRRARYRAEHRGTKELDLILGPFAVTHLAEFDDAEMDVFERLLDQEETDLQSILVGLNPVPPGPLAALMHQIRAFQLSRAVEGARSE